MSMELYVTFDKGEYRVTTRKPEGPLNGVKTLQVPTTGAYLLLTAQATTDALQDSLEVMYNRAEDDILRWEDEGGKNERWDNEGENGSRQQYEGGSGN